MDHSWITSDIFWPSALGVIPVALAAAIICRWTWTGPTTRHAMWVAVLASFLAPMALLPIGLPDLLHGLRTDVDAEGSSVENDAFEIVTIEIAGDTGVIESTAERASPASAINAVPPATRPATREIAAVQPLPHTAVRQPREVVREASPPKPSERPAMSTSAVEARPANTSRSANERTPPATDTRASHAVESPREAAPMHTPTNSRTMQPAHVPASAPTSQTSRDTAAMPDAPSHVAGSREPALETVPAPVNHEANPTRSLAEAPLAATETVTAGATWSSRLASLRPRVNAWLDGLQNVRRAITSLPPMPTTIWLGGAFLIAVVTVARFAWIHRVLRDALPGSARVRELVAEEGARLGLTRLPVVRMVSARISPMVWCGRKCVLLLPESLWAELDEPGQRAVVVHELAHLKRRDHWVRWVELVVSVLYWWHPVVWWVRRRVREESDLCCDAWVTTLMPTGRRSYAQALLCTQAFVIMPGQGRPALGHGALTSAGRRFARRVTMVMKGRPSPRTSIWGTALSLGLLLAAAAATPILACPPDEKDKARAAEQAVKVQLEREKALQNAEQARAKALAQAEKERTKALQKAEVERKAALEQAQVARTKALEQAEFMRRAELATATAEKARVEKEAATTFEQFMQNRGQGGDDTTDLLRRLLDRIERLEQRLDTFERQGARSALPGTGGLATTPSLLPAPSVGGMTARSVTPPSGTTPQPTLASPRSPSTTVRSGGGEGGIAAANITPAPSTERISRQYTLPKGKLELLNQLMIREDVPVLVSPATNSITVHGTAEQHRIFKAFIDMIHPSAQGASTPAAPAQPASPASGGRGGRVSATDAPHAEHLQTAVASLRDQAESLHIHSESIRSAVDHLKFRAAKADDAEKQRIHTEMERLVAEMARLQSQAAEIRTHADQAQREAERRTVEQGQAR